MCLSVHCVGEPVLPGHEEGLEPAETVTEEDTGPQTRETRNHKVTFQEGFIKNCLQTNRDLCFIGETELFDILVYLDSQIDRLNDSSETRRSLFQLCDHCRRLGTIMPRYCLNQYQLRNICRDLENDLLDYELLYITSGNIPRLEEPLSPDILCRLLNKYKTGNIVLIGEVSGSALYIRGSWRDLEAVKIELQQLNYERAQAVVEDYPLSITPRKRKFSLSSEVRQFFN